MTRLLEEAIQRLKRLPESMQDSAARAVIMLVEEEPEPGDDDAIREGLEAYARGDYVTLDDWRPEMGLGDY